MITIQTPAPRIGETVVLIGVGRSRLVHRLNL